MESLIKIAKQQRDELEQQLIQRMPAHIISNGWEYYRTKKVFTVEVIEGNIIYGAVNGSAVYAVILDTGEFAYSKCTCPYQGYCKHMAAVLLHYTAMIGEDAEQLYHRLIGRQPSAAPAIDPKRGSQPAEGSGIEQWRQWFTSEYGESWKLCRQSLHPMQPVLSEIKGTAKAWEKSMQGLHWLHTIEFILEQVELAYLQTDSYNRYYYEMSFIRTVDPWIAQFKELTAALISNTKEITSQEQEWTEALVIVLRRQAMSEAPTLLRWDLLYQEVADVLGSDPHWRAAEKAELERMLKEHPAVYGKVLDFVEAALASIAFLDDEDDEALSRIANTNFDRTSELVYRFAELRLQQEEAQRFKLWMDYLQKQLAACRNPAILRPYLTLCRLAELRFGNEQAWGERMIALLPASYHELAAHLLELGKYEKWADLHLFLGLRPDELDIQDVRLVSKAAPQVMIPLYHQAVDESILSRNRQGYKTAVKLLKKLQKLYQSDKQLWYWDKYIKQLTTKYQRLRALQEELWKGKVIQ